MNRLFAFAWVCAVAVQVGADIWEFDLDGVAGAGLQGGNVIDNLGNSFGTGKEVGFNEIAGITYDNQANALEFHVGWGNHEIVQGTLLSSPYISSALYGPADMTQNAPAPLYSFDSSNGYTDVNSSGGRTGFVHARVTLTDLGSYTVAQQVADLLGSRWYFQVHTTMFEGGEIRGQLLNVTPVPEPQSCLAVGAALAAVAGWRRFAKKSRYRA